MRNGCGFPSPDRIAGLAGEHGFQVSTFNG
jgi:hypothetical protein